MNGRLILCAYVYSTAHGKRPTNRGPFWNFWEICDIIRQWGKLPFLIILLGEICLCLVGPETTVYVVIFRVRVVLKRTVVGDWRFDNLCGSHLQSQGIVFVSRWCYEPGPFNVIGQFSHDGIGWKTRVNKVCHQSLVGFDPSIVSQVGRLGPCIVKSVC